jgi:hypothetical protein
MTKSIRTFLARICVLSTFIACAPTNCDAQEFEWVNGLLTGSDNPQGIATDNAGNVYTVGRFILTSDFDPGPDEFLLTAFSGTGDVFIQKLDSDGNFIWAKSIYGYGYDDQASSIDVSPDGNEIYISGFFQDSADFDPGVGTYLVEQTGIEHDLFALKLDGDGNFQWVQNIPINGVGAYNSTIRRDIDGNVVFVGIFTGYFDFDPDPVESFPLLSDGPHATFMQRLDADGNFIWAKKIANIRQTDARIDKDLNIIVTGTFNGEVDFDGGPGEFIVDSEGIESGYALKVDLNGDFLWAAPFIGEASTKGANIQFDQEGNVLCSGLYQGTTDFDPSPVVLDLTSNGSYDHFFLKLSDEGDLLWAKSLGGVDIDWAKGIDVNTENEVFIMSAFFSEEIDLDPGIEEDIVTSYGDIDFYIEKLDEDGNLIWWKRSNGPEAEVIQSFTIDPSDQIYVVGQLSNIVDFDFCPTSEYNFEGDFASTFTLKLSNCFVYSATYTVTECESYTSPYGETYTESGTYYEIFEGECNCDSLITFEVTIGELDIDITQSGAELTAEETDPEATYQWVNCEMDYAEIPGETDQVFTATENGEYAVIVTAGTCVDTSDCFLIDNIGMEAYLTKMDVSIYPNPTNGNFTIQFGEMFQSVDLVIRNIAGEIIMNSTHYSVQSIPMRIEHSQGIYFVEIITDVGEQTFLKVICE